MLRIAKEISESQTASFSIFEDKLCKHIDQPHFRTIHVQTEITCEDALLSTDLTIGYDESHESVGSKDLVFWRAVATQRARELDALRESIEKIRSMTEQNLTEKRALDEKHDALYLRLQQILENTDSEIGSDTHEEGPS